MNTRARAADLSADDARRPWLRFLIVLLVLAAVIGVIVWATMLAHQRAAAPQGGFGGRGGRRPSATVGVAAATLADVPITLDALGTVTPAATVTVTPQVSGMITQILFTEGQLVKKGQVLAIIDPRPLQMALLQAQGTLTRDQAQLTNARLLLERDRTLLTQDSIARQDVDTQAALVQQLEGTVTTDKAAVGMAQLNLGYSSVVAPVTGRVGLRAVDIGNYITTGSSTGIVVLTEISPIDVQFTISQDEVPRLQAQAAKGKLAVTAYDRTKTIALETGAFSTLDNQVDTTTGTVKGKARFANTSGNLFPSQFVNTRINLQTLKNAVVVPVTAVRTGPNGDFVWKLNPDKTVTQRKVVRGPSTPTTVSILQGLSAGERVITEGGDRLTDGAHVQLPGDRPGMGGRGRHRRPGQTAAADAGGGGQAGGAASAASDGAQAQPGGGGQGRQRGQGGQGAAPDGSAGASGGAQQAGGGPSPEMQAARQALMQACSSDMKTLCDGMQGREMFMCLRENAEKVSAPCKAAMAKMPHRPPGGAPAPGA